MTTTRGFKIAIGIATLLPLAYMAFFFIFMISSINSPPSREATSQIAATFRILFVLHITTMAWTIGLLVFYITNVFNNPRVVTEKKAIWAVVLFMGNILAMPIYWYLYVWPSEVDGPVHIDTPPPDL